MLIQLKRRPGRTILLLCAEDLQAFRVQESFGDEILEPVPILKRGVQLDERGGPEETALHLLLHPLVDSLIANRDEAADVSSVVLYDSVTEVEYVHEHSGRAGKLS